MKKLINCASILVAALACTLSLVSSPAFAQETDGAVSPERSVLASCPPGIPPADCQATIDTYNFVTTHNFAAPPGLSGNKPYQNSTGLLPAGGDYLEYDIYPPGPSGRLSQRLVVDRSNVQGNSWYSPDHYTSFAQFYVLP